MDLFCCAFLLVVHSQEVTSKIELNLPDHFSVEFKDFLRQALKKDPKERPTARQLLKHPWLRHQSLAALAADQEEAAAVSFLMVHTTFKACNQSFRHTATIHCFLFLLGGKQ